MHATKLPDNSKVARFTRSALSFGTKKNDHIALECIDYGCRNPEEILTKPSLRLNEGPTVLIIQQQRL